MTNGSHIAQLGPADYARIIAARDARFDGLFYVAITSTGLYCRPVCPSRLALQSNRRFFQSAAEAERAGYRPCLRCRPELAPGRTLIEAVSRLAREAADRIAAGALNGRSVGALAAELGVSDRHLRRALERELGASPLDLAQTHRLLLAKRLLADTNLPVSQVAYASGFQSLRRFNATFKQHYRMPPMALRRAGVSWREAASSQRGAFDVVTLTLSYREPLAWTELLSMLRDDALDGVEVVDCSSYSRTLWVNGVAGVITVMRPDRGTGSNRKGLDVRISQSLVPALMPVLARVRRILDLDAEPALIDAHLAQGGLDDHVRRRPGVRLPGAFTGFEAAFRVLMRGGVAGRTVPDYAHRVVRELGSAVEWEEPRLTSSIPTARQLLDAGGTRLTRLGVPCVTANALAAVARAIHDGNLRLDRGGDPDITRRVLTSIDGIDDTMATNIMMRAMSWPDAFPAADCQLQLAANAGSAASLARVAERWRPWRAYAALHLWLDAISIDA